MEELLQRQNSQKNHESPADFAFAIKACDKTVFPNIHTLLKLDCSCKFERIISSLRVSMSHESLPGNALMHIHYTSVVDAVDIANKFTREARKMLELSLTKIVVRTMTASNRTKTFIFL
jgi:hypothetical protein